MSMYAWSTLLLVVAALSSCRSMPSGGSWCSLESGSTQSLRGLSAVDGAVVWASGAGGTVLRTCDGTAWERITIPGAAELDFRDIEAFDEDTAIVVSAGSPARVYRTADGGHSWTLVYDHPDERAFFDAMAFWDQSHGLAFSDPIEGRLLVIKTSDGGRSWQEISQEAIPQSPEGEAGFAASGTCLSVGADGQAWIGTGGPAGARVFRTEDGGVSWEAVSTPMLSGESSQGIFSLAVLSEGAGVAVGGDYLQPDSMEANAALTKDGGVSWSTVQQRPPTGYRSCVAWVDGYEELLVAVGPNGTDMSSDGGLTWERISEEGYHAVAVGAGRTVWGVGSNGRIAKLLWEY